MVSNGKYISLDNGDMGRRVPVAARLDLLPVADLAGVPPLAHVDVLLFKRLRLVLDVVLQGHDEALAHDLGDGDGVVKVALHHFLLEEGARWHVEGFPLPIQSISLSFNIKKKQH